MRTQIDIDVEVGQTVYINHEEYEVKKIFIKIFENSHKAITKEILFELKYQGTRKYDCFQSEYQRSDFLTTFEYKSYLIDLVNGLDDISK